MSPTRDRHIHTAKQSSTHQSHNSVRRPFSAQVDCAEWARDVSAHVTRTMNNSTPYDHTTPPPTPPNNVQSQSPRPSCDVTGLPAFDVPRQTAAYAHTPRPADHIVPRDGLCNASRKPGRYSARETFATPTRRPQRPQDRGPPKLPAIPKTLNSQNVRRPLDYTFRFPALLQDDKPQRPITSKHNKPQYRGVDVMPTATVTAPQMPTIPNAPMAPSPKLGTEPRKTPEVTNCFPQMNRSNSSKDGSSWGSRVHKRCPGEIFDITFNFWSPSRRRAEMSPPVSPRTSVSSESGSLTPAPEEPHIKKQRVDNSGAKATTSPTHNKNGYNHGPAPTGPANIWFEEGITRFSPIVSSADPHPGRPVDSSIPSYSELRRRRKESKEGYHTYLKEERRRASNPDERDAHLVFAVEIEAYKSHAREVEERLDKEARILGLTCNIPSRKRASTLTRRRDHKPSPHSTTSSSTLMRTNSDNNTNRFLTHIRTSQEARQRRRASEEQAINDARVFTHDDNTWLMGDPL